MTKLILTALLFLLGSTAQAYLSGFEELDFIPLTEREERTLPRELQGLYKDTGMLPLKAVMRAKDGLVKTAIVLGDPTKSQVFYSLGGTYTQGLYMDGLAESIALATNGMDYDKPRWRDVVYMLKNNKAAFVFSEPRGFGAGAFKHIQTGAHQKFGIIDMISDFQQAAKLYAMVSGKPIIAMGHSLGGVIIDSSPTGYTVDQNGEIYFDEDIQKSMNVHVLQNILVGAPFSGGDPAVAQHVMDALLETTPLLQSSSRPIRDLLRQVNDQSPMFFDMLMMGAQIGGTFFQEVGHILHNMNRITGNNIPVMGLLDPVLQYLSHSRSLLMNRNLTHKEMRRLVLHTLADSYPELLLKQYGKLFERFELSIPDRDGVRFDTREAFMSVPAEYRIPSVISVGTIDAVVPGDNAQKHYDLYRSQGVPVQKVDLFDVGHVDSPMGAKNGKKIARAARDNLKGARDFNKRRSQRLYGWTNYCQKVFVAPF